MNNKYINEFKDILCRSNFFKKYFAELKSEEVNKFIITNLNYLNMWINSKNCSKCKDLEHCKNDIKNKLISINLDKNNKINFNFKECPKKCKISETSQKKGNYITYFGTKFEIDEINSKNLEKDILKFSKNKADKSAFNYNLFTECIKNFNIKNKTYFIFNNTKFYYRILSTFLHDFRRKHSAKKICYISIVYLINNISSNYYEDNSSKINNIIQIARDSDLLIIDEIGRTPFIESIHNNIITEILKLRLEKTNIFISSIELFKLKNYYLFQYTKTKQNIYSSKINSFINILSELSEI